ncbi:hypothetical protein [Rheinheimera sp.]|uniref:hypothetical protein n=1 Tax=Rheinheimera sp. TaxID=1869214 RepID=UPI00307E00B4
MTNKSRPLSLVALATSVALQGCGGGGGEETIVKTPTSLWCPSPEIVQTVDSDFYPLSAAEIAVLRDAAAARDGEAFDEANFNPYTYDFSGIDLFNVLPLTKAEKARQVTAKAEARAFKISQGQQEIFGAGFDSWFDSWFASVPESDYLGKSERLDKAKRGYQLNLSSANNSQEICYTPPASCPNYQEADPTGTYACITPEQNPLADIQPGIGFQGGSGQAVIFYKAAGHVDGGDNTAVYKDVSIHSWNDPDCTAYKDESTTNWGQGKAPAGIDPNFGMYWVLDMVDAPSQCGNIIVYNTVTGTKKISEADLRLPLGNAGAGALANIDKMSFLQDGIKPNNYDGELYANQHPLMGAAAGGSKACGWGKELDASGEICVGQDLANQCPTGTVAVGVGQEEIASKCIPLFNPAETTMYLRGGFNDWGTGTQMNYLAGKFRVHLNYGNHPASATPAEDGSVNYGFKVADANWSEASTFGAIKGGDTPGVGKEVAVTAGNGVGQDMFIGLMQNTIYQFVLNATDPAAVTLKVDAVPLAVFPSLTIDGEATELDYKGNGIYSLRTNLTPDSYSIRIVDAERNFALGAGTDTSIDLNETYPLVSDGTAVSLVIGQQNDYDFILDLADTAAPTLKVIPGKPLGNTPVFLRGSLNGWGAPATDELQYDEASRTYSVIYGLEASTSAYQFKFASEDWSTVDLGFSKFDISTDADALPLTEVGGNIAVTIPKSTSYRFTLNYANAKPVLKVAELPIFVRGGMNGWGEVDQLEFAATDAANTNEAGHVYQKTLSLGADNVFFKIATADWSTINLGAPTDDTFAVQEGQTVELNTSNGNLAFDPASAGDYKFSFDQRAKTLVVTKAQ